VSSQGATRLFCASCSHLSVLFAITASIADRGVGFDPCCLQFADEGIDVLHLKTNVIHRTAFGLGLCCIALGERNLGSGALAVSYCARLPAVAPKFWMYHFCAAKVSGTNR